MLLPFIPTLSETESINIKGYGDFDVLRTLKNAINIPLPIAESNKKPQPLSNEGIAAFMLRDDTTIYSENENAYFLSGFIFIYYFIVDILYNIYYTIFWFFVFSS